MEWNAAGTEPVPETVDGMLASLADYSEVSIFREEPSYAAGFIGTWSLANTDPVGFIERLEQECGGSVYRVQPLVRQPNGQKYFGKGMRRIRVAGEPKHRGRPWGSRDTAAMATPTVIAATPTPQSSASPLAGVETMMQIVTGFTERLAGIEARLSQPAPQVAPAMPDTDPLKTTLATLAALERIKKFTGGFDDDDDGGGQPPADPMQQMMMMAMAKFMGGDSPQPQPQSQPQPQPQPQPQDGYSGPRLIRNEPQAQNEEQPASVSTGAAAVAERLAQLQPHEAVQFLTEVSQQLPPQFQALLAQHAASKMGA